MKTSQLAPKPRSLMLNLVDDVPRFRVVGESAAILEIVDLIRILAKVNSTVLITGESGVGKEVVARSIHEQSARKEMQFLAINCSAIPDNLVESELFGHTRGAFTGAVHAQEGFFRRARNGSLFLDEIGELSSGLQAKLLRVIEEKEVLPLGSGQPEHVDVRILAATNSDLGEQVDKGLFRTDLYHRLNVVRIKVPPLRERPEDIPVLADFLIQRNNAAMQKSYQGIDNQALEILIAHPWSGNVRELDNILEHAMIFGNGNWVTSKDIARAGIPAMDNIVMRQTLKVAVARFEKLMILDVLKEVSGDRTRGAKLLGLSRATLYRKMERLGIAASP